MENYRVTFFKLVKEKDAKEKLVNTGQEYLGSIVVDDSGVDNGLTITAKAFRQCSNACTYADKVTVEKL